MAVMGLQEMLFVLVFILLLASGNPLGVIKELFLMGGFWFHARGN